mmetsp:Transcript_131629/g.380755  ORF Transcript_131629/g.380755 Transcript_131629/m.380755 type:complete len:534 (-) Transcript_131629:108-1709(-)
MLTDAAKSHQYAEFFMTPGSGRRKLNLGSASVMDTLILGRDTDCSGEDPHKDFMAQFGDHAGKKSGDDDGEKCRKAPGYALCSQLDTVIWGRDMDRSDNNPQDLFDKKFGGCAGTQVMERSPRPSRRGGVYSMSSTMDTVIWGRDFDVSGADPHEQFMSQYSAHAGKQSGHGPERPFRKLIQGNGSVMGEVLRGSDVDFKAKSLNDRWRTTFGDYAGVKSGQKPDKPYRKPGMSMKSSADNVIWGRDLDQSGDDFHEAHFEQFFCQSAGRLSGDVARAVAQKARVSARDQRLNSSRSDPMLTGRRSSRAGSSLTSMPVEPSQAAPASSADKYVPQPPAAQREGELTTARSGSGSATAREAASFKPPSRSGSQGSLTYRAPTGRSSVPQGNTQRTSSEYGAGCWAATLSPEAMQETLRLEPSPKQQTLQLDPSSPPLRPQRSSSVGSLSASGGARSPQRPSARSPRPPSVQSPAPSAEVAGLRPASEAGSIASSAVASSATGPRQPPSRPGCAIRRTASTSSLASSGASRPRWR